MTDYVSFSKAAAAIKKPEKTLRGWLDRKQVELDADDRPATAWRRFSRRDIEYLSIVAGLSCYLPIPIASLFAQRTVGSDASWLTVTDAGELGYKLTHYSSREDALIAILDGPAVVALDVYRTVTEALCRAFYPGTDMSFITPENEAVRLWAAHTLKKFIPQ